MKIAIMASGNGSNAQAIIDRIKAGKLDASIEIIVSNRADAFVLTRAQKAGIKSACIERKDYPSRREYDIALAEKLTASGCELVVLAGYMLLLGHEFLDVFPDRIVNIHPALLPSFPGTGGIGSALAYGVKISGPSVHFVEEKVDSGPLIIQAALPVRFDDTLESLRTRIHSFEHRIYPQALQWLAEGRISREGRMVRVAPGSRKTIKPDGDWFVWPPLEEGF